MKKLYISFILIFGFLTFVPQIALGDEPFQMPLQQIEKIKKEQAKELQCLQEKKLKISKKYTGGNLKQEIVKDFQESRLAVETIKPKTIGGKEYMYHGEHVLTGSPQTKNSYTLDFYGHSFDNHSVVVNCKEYIITTEKRDGGYDITNVPVGSYLKYIPETKEMQVLPPGGNIKSGDIKNQSENLENQEISAEQKKVKRELENKDAIMCVYKKKLELPAKYTGPNLKAQALSGGKRLHGSTGIDYLVGTSSAYVSYVKSDGEDCYEYITHVFAKNTNDMVEYDVTNVPAFSSLKFIPETQEMEVSSPRGDSDKMFIKNKMQDIEIKAKELEEIANSGNTQLIDQKIKELEKIENRQMPLTLGSISKEEFEKIFNETDTPDYDMPQNKFAEAEQSQGNQWKIICAFLAILIIIGVIFIIKTRKKL